ncbi:MAG: F0F1 ATP synthase subunit delta [Verrucomicrobia bacterium]|nr:F0F1 ATP synthase subunit delta [Verrucomicrobiota bacterium]
MRISKQARREAKALFRACQVAGLLEAGRVRQAVAQVIAQHPRGHVAILTHFQRLVKLDVQRRAARIESAVRLTEAQRTEVQARLGRLYGAGLEVAFAENTALLGGLRVRVGSDVYDGSIQSRLARLKESF